MWNEPSLLIVDRVFFPFFLFLLRESRIFFFFFKVVLNPAHKNTSPIKELQLCKITNSYKRYLKPKPTKKHEWGWNYPCCKFKLGDIIDDMVKSQSGVLASTREASIAIKLMGWWDVNFVIFVTSKMIL